MENLLDYLLYALFGHNVTACYANRRDALSELVGQSWTIVFEDNVYIVLSEQDLVVIRQLYEERCERLNVEERYRYNKIFELCNGTNM